MSSSDSRRKRSRTFKARRALIACQRCRHLKKSCQPTDGERCERCNQSDHVCIYMSVPDDPLARAGPSPAALVPDSPTFSPMEPLTPEPSFVLYPSDSLAEIHSAHHVTRDNHPPFHSTHNFNPPSGGLSIPSGYIFPQPPPLFPPDDFLSPPFDPFSVYNDELYDGSEALSVQTPLPFTTNQHSTEDMLDPPYAHHYLRSTPNPSLQTHNHPDNFTIPNPAPLSLNLRDTTSFLPDFSPVASTSNLNHHLNMSTSSQSSYLEDFDFRISGQLFCRYCSPGSEDCALHGPNYSYRCESSTEDEMED